MPLILLINLKKRNDRLSKMSSRLRGLDFTVIEATEGVNLDHSISLIKSSLSNNEKACSNSHIKAIKHFLNTNEKTCIILEDDVVFGDNFFTLARSIDKLPPEVEVVKLETARKKVILKKPFSVFMGFKLYELNSFHIGSAAYLVSRCGAELILAELEKYSLPSDHAIFESFLDTQFSRHVFQMYPACCMQEHLISNVDDSDISKERKLKFKKDFLEKTKEKSTFKYKVTREIFRLFGQLKLSFFVLKNYRRYKYVKVKFR